MATLTTICFSHYNERARWALDRSGVAYRERAFMPGFHFLGVWTATREFGKADAGSSRFSTPLLVTEDGRTLTDSSDIVRYADAHAPSDKALDIDDRSVRELTERWLTRVGPHTRRVAYAHLLADRQLWPRMAGGNVGAVQSQAFRLLAPALRSLLIRGLSVTAKGAKRSLEIFQKELAFANERCAEREFLVGSRFTDADLTFACMIAPLILPSPSEGYHSILPGIDQVAPEFGELVASVRQTPAGRFALRMFADHR